MGNEDLFAGFLHWIGLSGKTSATLSPLGVSPFGAASASSAAIRGSVCWLHRRGNLLSFVGLRARGISAISSEMSAFTTAEENENGLNSTAMLI